MINGDWKVEVRDGSEQSSNATPRQDEINYYLTVVNYCSQLFVEQKSDC
jgi:hypothetical protein